MGSHHRWESPWLPWTAGLEQGAIALYPLAKQWQEIGDAPISSSLLPHLGRAGIGICSGNRYFLKNRESFPRFHYINETKFRSDSVIT